jgi:predicted DNA-binding protein
MASIRVSPSMERLINDALKRLPVSQTREQFIEDAVERYVEDLKRRRYRVK